MLRPATGEGGRWRLGRTGAASDGTADAPVIPFQLFLATGPLPSRAAQCLPPGLPILRRLRAGVEGDAVNRTLTANGFTRRHPINRGDFPWVFCVSFSSGI